MGELREHEGMRCRSCGHEERASEGYPCATCGTFICLMCVFKGVIRCATCEVAAADPATTTVTRIDAVTPVTPRAAMADVVRQAPVAPPGSPPGSPQASPKTSPPAPATSPPAPSPATPSSAASALSQILLPEWPEH